MRLRLLDRLRRHRDPVAAEPHHVRSFVYLLPGNVRVEVEAPTTAVALDIVRRDYGARASREAWLVGTKEDRA